MNNLAKTLYELRDKLVEEENPWGVIPDANKYKNPENMDLIKSIFGPYYDDGREIHNILIMDYDIDPDEIVKEENITSVKQFVDYFKPILKKEGYFSREK